MVSASKDPMIDEVSPMNQANSGKTPHCDYFSINYGSMFKASYPLEAMWISLALKSWLDLSTRHRSRCDVLYCVDLFAVKSQRKKLLTSFPYSSKHAATAAWGSYLKLRQFHMAGCF